MLLLNLIAQTPSNIPTYYLTANKDSSLSMEVIIFPESKRLDLTKEKGGISGAIKSIFNDF